MTPSKLKGMAQYIIERTSRCALNRHVTIDHAGRLRIAARHTLLVIKSSWYSLGHNTPGPRACLFSSLAGLYSNPLER